MTGEVLHNRTELVFERLEIDGTDASRSSGSQAAPPAEFEHTSITPSKATAVSDVFIRSIAEASRAGVRCGQATGATGSRAAAAWPMKHSVRLARGRGTPWPAPSAFFAPPY